MPLGARKKRVFFEALANALFGMECRHLLWPNMQMNIPPSPHEYRIASEPRGPAFEALLNYCGTVGCHCSFVDQFPRTKKGREARERFLESAKPHLLGIDEVTSWPGSGISNGTVPLWKLSLDSGFREVLLATAKGLYDFQAPKLPEDLAVYREDGSVLLGSVAHEHMAWMNLAANEINDVRLGLVELRRNSL